MRREGALGPFALSSQITMVPTRHVPSRCVDFFRSIGWCSRGLACSAPRNLVRTLALAEKTKTVCLLLRCGLDFCSGSKASFRQDRRFGASGLPRQADSL